MCVDLKDLPQVTFNIRRNLKFKIDCNKINKQAVLMLQKGEAMCGGELNTVTLLKRLAELMLPV